MKFSRVGLLVVSLLLSACASTQVGIGGNSQSNESSDAIEVLTIDYRQSLDIAVKVIETHLHNVQAQMKSDRSGIVISNRSFWAGDVKALIEPILVKDRKSKEIGVVYKIRAEGVGFNASLAPGYISDDFFEGLNKYQKDHSIIKKKFTHYQILKDKGVTKKIRASIPRSFVGFKKYIDDKASSNSYEGIWSSADGEYTLGIIKDNADPRYNYSAFIIESKKSNWKPGEIKARFTSLSKNDLVLGQYHMSNKQKLSMTWKIGSKHIISINSPIKSEIALIKIYPVKRSSLNDFSGVGTGWAITNDGVFVTNAHVVKDAQSISIGLTKSSAVEASVLLIDERLDLALLKIDENKRYRPIPISSNYEETGSKVLAIGFPLAFDLGSEARITNGLISAQSGHKSDVTRYQVSVPVQGGNSGGPLINDKGSVVGVIVSKLTGDAIDNVSFAIKSKYLVALLEQAGIKVNLNKRDKIISEKQIYKNYKSSILPVWTK